MAQALVEQQPIAKNREFTHVLSTTQLKQAVVQEADRRHIIRDFVRSQLEPEKDYGRIDIRNKNGGTSQTKPVLFKSGMEKIFSLFNVVSTLKKDTETIEMIGKPGLIAYKCTLTRSNQFIGEGRGACDITEKSRVNDAIKIAEKRARMDACLNLGFSEYFTQDLEDLPEPIDPQSRPPVQPSEVAASKWRNGEVKTVTFTVQEKEMKSAQNGTVYAILDTTIGVLKSWKNTFNSIEEGKTYAASVEASEWNGTVSLSVVRVYQEMQESRSFSRNK